MTRDDAIQKLREAQDDYDIERAHANADAVIWNFLIAIGYEDIADEYLKVSKWYA